MYLDIFSDKNELLIMELESNSFDCDSPTSLCLQNAFSIEIGLYLFNFVQLIYCDCRLVNQALAYFGYL